MTIQTRGPYRNGQHSRGQVLLAATVVFAEHGYAAGSLRKIAEQAAMTEPGVLRLFGSWPGLNTGDPSSNSSTMADAMGSRACVESP